MESGSASRKVGSIGVNDAAAAVLTPADGVAPALVEDTVVCGTDVAEDWADVNASKNGTVIAAAVC